MHNASRAAISYAGTFPTDIGSFDNRELQDEIRRPASYTAAAMCRLLLLIAELDSRGAWNEWGMVSCAHWLSWQCGFSPGTAREHVRVARALLALPRTISLFEKGELSYAKVWAISRVATPENEELLVYYARDATASQLERIVRGHRNAKEVQTANEADDPAETSRRLSCDAPVVISLVNAEGVVLERSPRLPRVSEMNYIALHR